MRNDQFIQKVEKVLTCTSKGEITNLGARVMRELVDQCLEDVEDAENAMIKCNKLLSAANICFKNGYLRTAEDLSSRLLEEADLDYARTGTFRCLQMAYAAAKMIDKVWAKIAPKEPRESVYARTVYKYMISFDDYRYVYLNEDNEIRFKRIHDYALRHNLKD